MIDKTRTLPVTTQCRLLDLNRSTAYYQPAPTSEADLEANSLELMRRIDRIHMKYPFMGSRRIPDELELDGVETDEANSLEANSLHGPINRKRVQRLMRQMGIQALHPKPKTSAPGKAHKIYPYQLRGLAIDHPRQVYAADITYIPMAKGFLGRATVRSGCRN